jgi:hypothetical protein
MQGNASKKAFIAFHWLSFIFPNRDFSMGYGQKIEKSNRVSGDVQNVSVAHFPSFRLHPSVGGARMIFEPEKGIALVSD